MSIGPQKITPARDLKECVICLRRFTLDRITAHETICKNSSSVNRKCFDMSQQRISGTEIERFAKSTCKDRASAKPPKTVSCTLTTNWRRKHEELIKIINDKKKKNEIKPKVNDLPFPPPTDAEDEYVHCPHCSKPLLKESASLHINSCELEMCKPKSKSNVSDANLKSSQTAVS